MYCPQCGAEQGHDVTECQICGAPLVPGPRPPAARAPVDPSGELSVVLDTNDRMQFAMAKGLLEDAEIPFSALGEIATLVQDIDPFLRKRLRLQVPRSREAEARSVLEPLIHPIAEDTFDTEGGN